MYVKGNLAYNYTIHKTFDLSLNISLNISDFDTIEVVDFEDLLNATSNINETDYLNNFYSEFSNNYETDGGANNESEDSNNKILIRGLFAFIGFGFLLALLSFFARSF